MDASKLDHVSLLQELEPAAIAFLAEKMQEVAVPIGGHVVREGEHAYRFFAIIDGKVVVSHEEEVIATLGPGDVFGEMALVEDKRRNANVIAVTPANLACMMAWDFREALSKYPDLAKQVDELIVERS